MQNDGPSAGEHKGPENFGERLEYWNEHGEYQKIIDAIEAIPPEERTPDFTGQLARAYNNLAEPEDRHLFKKAIELLKSIENECSGEHTWNFRMGYACYYLDQERTARQYFEKALEYCPGDEDTLEFIDSCDHTLAMPISMKPFRQRTLEGWNSFLAGEAELRALMDAGEKGQKLTDLCGELLAPAFEDICFELGFNGKKYELILTAEGDRAQLFKLVYFKNHAPEELAGKWNIIAGRQPSKGFALQMFGLNISAEDVTVWAEPLENRQAGLSVYCEKLLPLLRDNEDQAYVMMAVLLDQVIGEIAAIRYIGYMDLLDAPGDGEHIGLGELPEYLKTRIDPEDWDPPFSADDICDWYTCYETKPAEEEDAFLRQDIFAGVTSCPSLINCYFRGDDTVMENFHQDGAVPGFFYYPLDGIDQDGILGLRDSIEQAVLQAAGDAVTFTGGATGREFCYLDFIAWDLRAMLDAAEDAFAVSPVVMAAFHTFRRDVRSVRLKQVNEE